MNITFNLKIKFYLVSILHFLVDGICAYTVFNNLYLTDNYLQIILIFIGYNSFAFLLQPFVGILIDKVKKEREFLSLSLLMLLVGAIIPFPKIIKLVLIGIANSIFHVTAGKYTIYESRGKLSHLGIFVSLGATGLAIGTYISSSIVIITFAILTIILGIICHILKDERIETKENNNKKITNTEIKLVILLALAVLIRGMIGKAGLPLFETTTSTLILIAISSTLGKMIGGIIADKIGIKLTVFITLSLSLIGYIFFRNNIYIYLLSTILFNTTMPITLFLSNKNLKNREGLSFGILAFMLFPGYLLGELYVYLHLPFNILLPISIILTILLIIYANNKTKKEEIQ